ncbi:hypothetical protein BH11GEM2_BH11GEM2_18150 [soil metagenome]
MIRVSHGRQRVVHTEVPGGTLAEVPLFEGGTLPATAEALEPTRCLILHGNSLHAIMRDDPAVALLFLRRLSSRVRELVDRLDHATNQSVPRWSRDGRFVTFLSARAGQGVFQHRADGLGKDSVLKSGLIDEGALSPDGAWLVIRSGSNGSVAGGRDITAVRMGAGTTRVPLIVTPFDEEAIALSPDGKWIAYQSDESGKTEIFVRSFPNTSTFKHQVSNGGGTAPLWSRDGKELFFVSGTTDMMTARVTAGSPISVAAPVPLFHIADELLRVEYAFYTPWDVAADGRFIMARARRTNGANGTTVVVAENWLTELKAKLKQ